MKTMLAMGLSDLSAEICPDCGIRFDWVITTNGKSYCCPKCGNKPVSHKTNNDTSNLAFVRGEVVETGISAPSPHVEYEKLEEELLYRWPEGWPVMNEYAPNRCPECGSVGQCIANEMLIDVRVRIMSCTICDSFWRIEE